MRDFRIFMRNWYLRTFYIHVEQRLIITILDQTCFWAKSKSKNRIGSTGMELAMLLVGWLIGYPAYVCACTSVVCMMLMTVVLYA